MVTNSRRISPGFLVLSVFALSALLISCTLPSDSPPVSVPRHNTPPHPVTGPSGLRFIVPISTAFLLEVNSSTNPLDFDPDGDPVTFILDSFTIDTAANEQYILDNYDISDAGVFSIPWHVDLRFDSATFTIYTDDGQDQTAPDEVINVYFP